MTDGNKLTDGRGPTGLHIESLTPMKHFLLRMTRSSSGETFGTTNEMFGAS